MWVGTGGVVSESGAEASTAGAAAAETLVPGVVVSTAGAVVSVVVVSTAGTAVSGADGTSVVAVASVAAV